MLRQRWTGDDWDGASPVAFATSELYCHAKAAQAQAESWGFTGTAAALADIAATFAAEAGARSLPEAGATRH